ncbi:MAG: amidohydrolase family protein [Bacteroidota bacterium]
MLNVFLSRHIYLLSFFLFFPFFGCDWTVPHPDAVKAEYAITDALIVCMDSSRHIITDGTILIGGGKILAIAPGERGHDWYEVSESVSAEGKLVMPGLINTHTHSAMTLMRGLADDLPLDKWLREHIWPAEKVLMDSAAIVAGTQLAMAEMIRSGTTTFNDMYFFAGVMAEVVDSAGMRAIIGEGIIDFPTPSCANAQIALDVTKRLIEQYRDHSRISISVAPHSVYATNEENLGEAISLAKEMHAPVHIHVSETQIEQRNAQSQFAMSPMAYLKQLGMLDVPQLIAAHGVHLSPADQQLLQTQQAGIAHCPESNMKLASGVAPVPDLLQRGIPVGMGTDGAASNNNLDLFESMGHAALLQKVHRMDPTALPAEQVVEMATIGGAHVLGLDQITGSIEVGKAADLLMLDLSRPALQPFYNPYSQLVYSARGSDVSDVMVEGQFLMRNRKLLTLQEADIIRRVKALQSKIVAEFSKQSSL